MGLKIILRPNADGYSENFSVCEFKQRLEDYCHENFSDLDSSREVLWLYCTLNRRKWELEVFVKRFDKPSHTHKPSKRKTKGDYTSNADWYVSEGDEIRRIMVFDNPEEVYQNLLKGIQEIFDFNKNHLAKQKAESEETISRARWRLNALACEMKEQDEIFKNYSDAMNEGK